MRHHCSKVIFSITSRFWLRIASWLGVSRNWDPVWLAPLKALCVLPQALWVHMSISHVACGAQCFLGVIHHLWLWKCFSDFCIGPWPMKGKLEEDVLFRTWVFQNPSLCTLSSCESLCSFLDNSRVSVSDGWPRLIYEYSRMPLRLILVLCSFDIRIIFCFPLWPWSLQSQVLDHPP